MARPKKENLDYFPMDSDFFKDKTIKVLLSRFGSDGVVVYLYIICEIYGKKGYFLEEDEDFCFIAAQNIGIQKEEIDKIVAFLIERGTLIRVEFNSRNAVITSRDVQKRYQESLKKCRCSARVKRDIWILDENETENFIDIVGDCAEKKDLNAEETDVNTEKKAKKGSKKEKKNSNLVSPEQEAAFFEDVDIDREFRDFLRNREINGIANTKISVKKLINKLSKFPKNVAIESINRAIENNWRGLYPEGIKQCSGKSTREDPFKEALEQIERGDLYDIK